MERKIMFLYFCWFTNLFLLCACENTVPVLMWESHNSPKFMRASALGTVSDDEFSNYVSDKIKSSPNKPHVILFLKNDLSLEDFSSSDFLRHHSYSDLSHLRNSTHNVNFLPSVQSPYRVIMDLTDHGYTQKKLSDLNNNDKAMLFVVRLDDEIFEEGTSNALNQPGKFITEISEKLASTQNNFIAILTGKNASWKNSDISLLRVRRLLTESNDSLAATSSESNVVYNAKGKIILVTSKPPTLKVNGETETLTSKSEDMLDSRENYLRLIATYSKKTILRFKFEMSSGFWTLTQVDYTFGPNEGFLYPSTPIQAPIGRSFLSNNPVVFYSENKTASLRFENMKAQAWANGLLAPAESNVTFFTIPIWTGIFVVGLLSLIMMWGLTMILDIKTMDQFDDPKGKTISINVSD